MLPLITFGSALIFSWLGVRIVRMYGFRTGRLVKPRADRWHRRPTPTMGGVGIFCAFAGGLVVAGVVLAYQSARLDPSTGGIPTGDLNLFIRNWGFLAGSAFIFGLGLYDDIRHISPPAKLIGQIVAAAIVISLGYTTGFFTPRLANNLVALLPNILLTFIWLVSITNAINLLDNMDGLAAGISLIAALLLSFLFWQAGNISLLLISVALAGSLVGFLVYNFPPASIFMGDSGSMFLGFTLAALAIARQPQASNVFAILGVPTLLFLLPILDTILVTVTRLMRGQSPARGGRDHTSHRLIAFGLTEKQVLWVLYSVAALSGVIAIAIERTGYWLSLIVAPLLLAGLALVTAYLSGIKVGGDSSSPAVNTSPVFPLKAGGFYSNNPLVRVILNLTFKRRILEVILDFLLILFAFYLAFTTLYGSDLSDERISVYVRAIPIVLAISYLSFFRSGIYKGVWRYIGVDDLIGYFKAATFSTLFSGGAIYILFSFRFVPDQLAVLVAYPPVIFLLFGIYLFLFLSATRSSFRVLDRISSQRARTFEEKVLIIGAGDAGEMALRWIMMKPELNYRTVGFIDDDPLKTGRNIHGVAVLGDGARLEEILDTQQINGVIITEQGDSPALAAEAAIMAKRHGCWIKKLRLDFEVVE